MALRGKIMPSTNFFFDFERPPFWKLLANTVILHITFGIIMDAILKTISFVRQMEFVNK